ncbi:MAG: hypothetical protein HND53_06775 [Proteobacteria bacterium]|nr:hypothetical protein [Pseudomonadota bacterium]NOG60188.1 hypothetical protein [Pseudomonadota bacterium]
MEGLTELDVLKDVVNRLEEAGLLYMLTGSMAMNYYAEPRMTRDIDIIIALQDTEPSTFIKLFKDDYYVSFDAVNDAIRELSMFNLIHLESVVKVDVIVKKTEQYRQLEFDRRCQINFAGIKLNIVSKEDLILSKLCWSKESRSELQFRDIHNLLNTGYDKEYLQKWANELDVIALLEKLEDE